MNINSYEIINFKNFDLLNYHLDLTYYYKFIPKIIKIQRFFREKNNDFIIIDYFHKSTQIKNINLSSIPNPIINQLSNITIYPSLNNYSHIKPIIYPIIYNQNQIIRYRYITLNYDDYFDDLSISFNNNSHIFKQFLKDFYRSTIFINQNKIDNHHDFIEYFNYILHNNHLLDKIFMITNQASLATPYEVLNNIYKSRNIYVIDNKDTKNFFLHFHTQNKLTLIIKKKFKIMKITSNENSILHFLNITIQCDFINKFIHMIIHDHT